MGEERRQILEMLSQQKITPEQAERLLAAVGAEPMGAGPSAKTSPKYLRIMVDDDGAHHGGKPSKVNIRIPMQLLRAGVKLAGFIPVQARVQVNKALSEKGLEVDLTQLKPENLETLIDQLSEFTVDVDEAHAKVRIFCE